MVAFDVLVGSTGFVGGNLSANHEFGLTVHSADVSRAYGAKPALLVYAGVTGAFFRANRNPGDDMAIVRGARDNIRKIGARKTVLISTINVYADSRGKDEDAEANGGLGAYGAHRLLLEKWVREDCSDSLIVRLPALFGRGLKKNFIHDLIDRVPPVLSLERYEDLSTASGLVCSSYEPSGDGFMRLKGNVDKSDLSAWFSGNEFNALSFTDSRSRFQFYNLNSLWDHIRLAHEADIEILNIATEPVSASDVYEFVFGEEWVNILADNLFDYDMRTKHASIYGGHGPYLVSRAAELQMIKRFVVSMGAGSS